MKLVRGTAAGLLYLAAVLLFLLAAGAHFGGGPAASMLFKLGLGAGGAAAIVGATAVLVRGWPGNRRRIVRTTLWVLFALYLAVLAFLLLGNGFTGRTSWAFRDVAERWSNEVNLVPFATVRTYLRWFAWGWDAGSLSLALVNIGGNLVAFAPCGVFVPLLLPRLNRFGWFLLSMTGVIVLVELLQLFTGTGICDMDDLLLNLAGSAAAYGLAHIPPVWRWLCRLAEADQGERPA